MKNYFLLVFWVGCTSVFAQLPPVNNLPSVASQAQPSRDVEAEHWKTYSSGNFEINYPPHWRMQEGAPPAKIILLSPQDDATPTLQENINIIEQDLQGQQVDLETIVEASAAQVESGLNARNVKIEYLGDIGRLHFVGSTNNRAMEWIQYYMLRNGYVYVVTFTAVPEYFELYLAEAERIMASLKF